MSHRAQTFNFGRLLLDTDAPLNVDAQADKSEDEYDPNLDDQDDKVTHYILVGLVAPH
jgi:hypothetical protein